MDWWTKWNKNSALSICKNWRLFLIDWANSTFWIECTFLIFNTLLNGLKIWYSQLSNIRGQIFCCSDLTSFKGTERPKHYYSVRKTFKYLSGRIFQHSCFQQPFNNSFLQKIFFGWKGFLMEPVVLQRTIEENLYYQMVLGTSLSNGSRSSPSRRTLLEPLFVRV